MPEPFDPAQADVLIQKYVSGELSPHDAEKLLAWMHERPQLGEELLGHLSLDAMMRELGKAGELPTAETIIPFPVAQRRIWPVAAVWGALAACFAVLSTLAIQSHFLSRRDVAPAEATTAAVALLSRAVDVQWSSGSKAQPTGAPLEPGWLRLKSGLVQVDFFNGARVVLEGPAEFQLVSAGEAVCTAGKLTAEVPPQARGFRVRTPQGTVVDLGTSFGLNVNGSGAEVHVFKGEVELHQKAGLRSLREGQGIAVAEGGQLRDIAANSQEFANPAQLSRQATESQREKLARWRAAGVAINSEPALLARFDFDVFDPADLRLRNVAGPLGANKHVADGTIVGCAATEGRWPGKRALAFRSISDRVRLDVPGTLESATLTAWVRVDGVDRPYNSLFMSEGFSPGALHWQITNKGVVRLGVSSSADYDTPVLFNAERLGQWVHLAVVFDAGVKEVRHYANGQLVARLPLKRGPVPLNIGIAELGNWNPAGRADRTPIRHFSGAMDEFALYASVLGEEEIRSLCTVGAP